MKNNLNQLLSKSKGITLIALIITIIVMLILVAVTISVTLDSGLFTTAKEAGKKTEIEAERETLQGIVIGAVNEDGNVNFENINLPTGWSKKGDGRYIVSPTGNEFTVYENGNIVSENDKSEDLKKLEEYALGDDKEGNTISTILDTNTFTFKQYEKNGVTVQVPENLTMLFITNTTENGLAYVKYNDKAYKITTNPTNQVTDSNNIGSLVTQSVELIYERQNSEGDTIEYNGEQWLILYDNGNEKEIVSPRALSELTLGTEDENATGNTDMEKAISSYNNSVKTINDYCKEVLPDENPENVRSVGAREDTTNKTLKATDLPNYVGDIFDEYENKIKVEDLAFEQDVVRLAFYNQLYLQDSYWIASRSTSMSSNAVYIIIRYVKQNELILESSIARINWSENDVGYNTLKFGVRPVVKIQAPSNP